MLHCLPRALPLALALWAQPLAAQFMIAYHDADGAEHQAQFDTLSATGYRMISLTAYAGTSSTLYAAVWVQRSGPNYVGFHGLNGTDYQALVDSYCGTYAPKILTATGPGNDPVFAGVLEQVTHPCWALHGIDIDTLNDEIAAAREQDWRIAAVDVYGDAGDTRYIVSFEPNDEKIGWGYYYANGASGHQALFDGMSQAFARPTQVCANDDGSRYFTVWEDSFVGQCLVHHDMTAQQYQDTFDEYLEEYEYYPVHVSASGSGSGERFAAVWAATDLPYPRKWSTTGVDVPELAGFDAWAKQYMQDSATRCASLAIVKDGRLVLARGYTWAESDYGYPLAQPDSLYRIASCTKPLTSIAVHQEMALQPASIAYDSDMADYFGNPAYADPRSDRIKVIHLLTHTGGWDRDDETGSGYDPMFIDTTVASTLGISLPVSTTDIRTYMDAQLLDFTPGTESRYSNYGFSLLGRILETLNPGDSYDDVMQARVFGPLGITRAAIGASYVAGRLPGEVMYHPDGLGVAQSVNEASRPWTPSHHGGWNQPNLDAHGAHVMAAPDYAKVLAAFHLGAQNPILDPVQTTSMWTAPGAPFIVPGPDIQGHYLKGWMRNTVTDGSGTKIDMYEHGGSLPGTRTYIAHREDGVSFVFFTNGNGSLGSATGDLFSDLANRVRSWPRHDLFPQVGLPSLRYVPGSVVPYGKSCPGTFGTPGASWMGVPETGNNLSLVLTLGRPNSPAFCLLGAKTQLPLPGGGGCWLLATPIVAVPTPTNAVGTAILPLAIPSTPVLIGGSFAAQFLFNDSTGAYLKLVSTNGLQVTVGGWLGY